MDKLSDALNKTLLKVASKQLIKEDNLNNLRALMHAGLVTGQLVGGWAITNKGIQYLAEHNLNVDLTSDSAD